MTWIQRSRRVVISTGLSLLTACAAADSPLQPEAERDRPNLAVQSLTRPVTGEWAGVVTAASDLGGLSFGRAASSWIGKTVRGSFVITLVNNGVVDRDPRPDFWEFGLLPGPGPFLEFVNVKAMIDGKTFQSSRAEYQTVFFGDVLGVRTTAFQSAFNPQDSFVGVGAAGVGRSVVGFDSFFAPGAVSIDGARIAIDPTQLLFANGGINDFLERNGTVVRDGTIAIRVTKVALSATGGLLSRVLELADDGALGPDQVAGLTEKLDEVSLKLEAGQLRAACNQLVAFSNQVRALTINGTPSPAVGESVIEQVRDTRAGLGC